MSTFLCTLHQVEYSATPRPECKQADLELARIPRCPVCTWKEYQIMRHEIEVLTKQRECLVLAIELKQQHLALAVKGLDHPCKMTAAQ